MIKKALILGLIVSGLLVCSTVFVTAGEEVDELDDVVDDDAEVVTNKPNIDIHKLSYSVSGDTVSLKLTVKGVIENKGNIDVFRLLMDEDYYEEVTAGMTEEEILDFFMNLDSDFVCYNFYLETTEDIYYVLYVNEEVLIYDDYYADSISNTFNVVDDELSVSFDFLDPEEELTNITIETTDLSEESFYDTYSTNGISPGVNSNNGNDGNDGNDGILGSNMLLFGIIMAVVIVGIVVLIYFVRR